MVVETDEVEKLRDLMSPMSGRWTSVVNPVNVSQETSLRPVTGSPRQTQCLSSICCPSFGLDVVSPKHPLTWDAPVVKRFRDPWSKNWQGSDLADANLTEVYLTDANRAFVNLTGANLTGANLTGAILRHCNLSRADLPGADLTDADLTGVDLTHTNPINANWIDAIGADFTGAILE